MTQSWQYIFLFLMISNYWQNVMQMCFSEERIVNLKWGNSWTRRWRRKKRSPKNWKGWDFNIFNISRGQISQISVGQSFYMLFSSLSSNNQMWYMMMTLFRIVETWGLLWMISTRKGWRLLKSNSSQSSFGMDRQKKYTTKKSQRR